MGLLPLWSVENENRQKQKEPALLLLHHQSSSCNLLLHDFDQEGRGLSGVGRGGGTPPTGRLGQCYFEYDLDDEDRNEFAYGMRKDGSLADKEAQIEGLVGPRNAYINQELNWKVIWFGIHRVYAI